MKLVPYEKWHNGILAKIAREVEPWAGNFGQREFDAIFNGRTGFSLENAKGEIVGSITFSDYYPGIDITVHNMVSREYHGRWLNRKICKEVFDHVFVKLGLGRCSTYLIEGCCDPVYAAVLEKLGFKNEGTRRRIFPVGEEMKDAIMFGLLKHERRW